MKPRIDNEIAIFEAFRATATELGLTQAVIHPKR